MSVELEMSLSEQVVDCWSAADWAGARDSWARTCEMKIASESAVGWAACR